MSQQISKTLKITNHSDQKPYADSTLSKKYKATGLSNGMIDVLHEYLTACANFFKIIDLEMTWKKMHKVTGERIDKAAFYAMVSADARNDALDYTIYPESYFFLDGDNDRILVVEPDMVVTGNAHFTGEDRKKFLAYYKKHGGSEGYEGEYPFCFDEEGFMELYRHKEIKRAHYYFPEDLLNYADYRYYTRTDKTEALKQYLIEKIKDTPEKAEEKTARIVEIIRDHTIDPMESASMSFRIAGGVDPFNENEVIPLTEDQLAGFMSLYQALSNSTYLPSNNGFSPDALRKRMKNEGRMPAIHFGRGLRDAISNGDIDPTELEQHIAQSTALHPEAKQAMMMGLAGAKETIKTDKKVGRNDPCPCGSGKKYKKCCGR